ncbi:YqgE/AlgH family protein [Pseudaestuariivita sp.]|uniref:YqgE/AlgH family protein n=1 Tax=Pseudaestuariivita sp. TaxID=2211669 RepID=UPI00405864F5
MAATTSSLDLTGQVLIAMPSMPDPRFEKAVVLIVAHSEDGAMGLIVNKPAEGARLKEMLAQLELPDRGVRDDHALHFGGPVEVTRGFVLFDGTYATDAPVAEIAGDLRMTSTLDVLRDIGAGHGPERSLIALGYAGWSPGQLENEIQQDGWLVAEAPADMLFDLPDGEKYGAAMRVLGIDGLNLGSGASRPN